MQKKKKVVFFFLLIILPAIIILKSCPVNYVVRDAGIFAYFGDLIQAGQVPYRDFWDHKTPLIYYLNAALFKVFGSSLGVIENFEILWIFLTCIIFYKLSALFFSRRVSLAANFIFAAYLASPRIEESPGMTETYAILSAITAVLCALKYKQGGNRSCLFMSGILAGIAFLFRQTEITIVLPIILYLAFAQKTSVSRVLEEYFLLGAGLAIPLIGFGLYFFFNGALPNCLRQVFVYNFFHAKESVSFTFFYLAKSLIKTTASELGRYPFLLACGLAGIIYAFFSEARKKGLFILLFSWLILAFYNVIFSGRFYGHYFLGLIPALALGCACLLEKALNKHRSLAALSIFLCAIFFIFSPLLSDISCVIKNKNYPVSREYKYTAHPIIISWLRQNTQENDFVYFWGADAQFNFFARRRCPTKYVSLYPLLAPGYTRAKDIERFVLDLEKNKPRFIIDTKEVLYLKPLLGQDNLGGCRFLCPAVRFIGENYIYSASLEGFDIYKLR